MDERLNGYSFATVASLRACLRSYGALRTLAQAGDVGSATIMLDLARALGDDPMSRVAVLSPRRRQAIELHLINDMSAADVAKEMNITCRVVYLLVNNGLERMLAYLQHGTQLDVWQPWQIDYLRHNSHLTRSELAQTLGRTVNAVGIALFELRKSGSLISTERYGRRVAGGRSSAQRQRSA